MTLELILNCFVFTTKYFNRSTSIKVDCDMQITQTNVIPFTFIQHRLKIAAGSYHKLSHWNTIYAKKCRLMISYFIFDLINNNTKMKSSAIKYSY